MSARKIEKFPVQVLSLDAIRVDHAIQSRVSTSMEYQREFSEAMLRGDIFPPVVVFFDGKVYWLADGFHRYGAAKQAAKANPRLKGAIRAEMREGSRRDAMIYSAGANIKFSIPRTAEDIKKAVWMLLDDEGWFGKSNNEIAKHCGLRSSDVAAKHRLTYCEARAIPVPDTLTASNGRQYPTHRSQSRKNSIHEYRTRGRPYYAAFVDGKRIYLSTDKVSAEKKLEACEPGASANERRISFGAIVTWMVGHDLAATSFSLNTRSYPSLYGFRCRGFVCTCEDWSDSRNAVAAVGRALLLKEYAGSPHPPIVVCYPDEGPVEILALGRRLGVEFLTPEELVARVKSGEPDAPPSEPEAPEDSPGPTTPTGG